MSVRPFPSALARRRAAPVRRRPPVDPTRPRPRRSAATAVGVGVLVVGLAWAARGELATRSADAAVTPTSGFAGTVLGWTSWYGAYDLGGLGWAWCIDHGSSAPDPDLAYVPTSIDGETDATTRAAMAWAVTMNPPHDPVTAAATMLVLHDLRGATYPFGALDVDRLGPLDLAGFDGAESTIIDRARAMKGDALAHAHLRHPFTLAVTADRAAPGAAGALRTTLTDAAGAPVTGVAIRLQVSGAALTGDPVGYTGADGAAWFGFVAATDNRFAAHADLPRSEPAVHAPTRAPAQRVIVPAWAPADGGDAYAPALPTTTTTTTTTAAPTSTTTRPTTTTTRAPTTTTTRPVATTTTTTRPTTTTSTTSPRRSTTTTSTTTASTITTTTTTPSSSTTSVPATTTTTAGPSPTTPAPPRGSPPPGPTAPTRSATLPVTGRSSWPWALIGTGLVLCGSTLTASARRARGGRPGR